MKKLLLVFVMLACCSFLMAATNQSMTFYPNAEVGVNYPDGWYGGLFIDDTFSVKSNYTTCIEPKVVYTLPLGMPFTIKVGEGLYTVFKTNWVVQEIRPRFDFIGIVPIYFVNLSLRDRVEIRDMLTSTIIRNRIRPKADIIIDFGGFKIIPTVSDEFYCTKGMLDWQDIEVGVGVKVDTLFFGIGNYFSLVPNKGYTANNIYAQFIYAFNVK
jgi:hypothetical protein